MKKLILIVAAVLTFNTLAAQQTNDKGLYVDSDGELFNGIISSHHEDVKFKITIKNGVVEGEAEYFYASGKLMETGIFKEGKKDNKWIRYNENSTIAAIGFYALGKKTGQWLVYDENGKKRFEMNFSNSEKIGLWTNWDENGIVVNTKNYNISN